jgi:hypothetical protein
MPDDGSTNQGTGQSTGGGQQSQAPAQTFTQADVDRILSDRLTRERGKFADYDDLKSKAAEFDRASDAQKTEAQRIAGQLAKVEKERDGTSRERDELRTQLARLEVALEHGISREDIDLLGSGSREEIDARAKRLAERLAPNTPPDFDGGTRSPAGKPTDMNGLIRRAAGLG